MGETVAFSICNKLFKPLGIPKGRVKSCKGLLAMIPTIIFFFWVLCYWQIKPFTQIHGSYIMSKFNKLNIQTTSSKHPNIIQLTVGKLRQRMLQKVQTGLTQGHGVSIILKENVYPKIHRNAIWWQQPRLKSKGANCFCVGCAMLDSLKLLNDLCNECSVNDSQTRWF